MTVNAAYPHLQWARDLYEQVKHTRPAKLPPAWDDMSGIEQSSFLHRWRVEQGILPNGETIEETMELSGSVVGKQPQLAHGPSPANDDVPCWDIPF